MADEDDTAPSATSGPAIALTTPTVTDGVGDRFPRSLLVPDAKSERQIDLRVLTFMDLVAKHLKTYWAPITKSEGYGAANVKHVWPREGQRVATACHETADQDSAFYCPADNTVYVGRRLAGEVWRNQILPAPAGYEAPARKKRGDMGLAFIIAHEYAHGLGELVGTRQYNPNNPTKNFELTADCAAGAFAAYTARTQKSITPKALKVAWTTAQAVGDEAYDDPDHHGTPAERRKAFDTGFRSTKVRTCNRYLTTYVPPGIVTTSSACP